MLFEILIVVAVVVFALALRTFDHALVRKFGSVLILVASYLVAYFVTESHVAGAAAVAVWFLLPWVELLTRIRQLRLPIEKEISHQTPPNSTRFPHLKEFTEEIEEHGFEYVDDMGWEWEGLNQFFRLFYHEEKKTQAAICLNEQHGISFVYVALTVQTETGRIYRTWNYPFSYSMKMVPDLQMHRVPDAHSFSELSNEHEQFLALEGLSVQDLMTSTPEELEIQLTQETQAQIQHNLEEGVIAMDGQDKFRYSWRGLFFLYAQFVKDMVKLH